MASKRPNHLFARGEDMVNVPQAPTVSRVPPWDHEERRC